MNHLYEVSVLRWWWFFFFKTSLIVPLRATVKLFFNRPIGNSKCLGQELDYSGFGIRRFLPSLPRSEVSRNFL